MPKERYFIDQTLDAGLEVMLDDSEFHHLTNVMRTKEGDPVSLINGQGYLAQASVTQINKKNARLIIDSVQFEKPSDCAYAILQAIPRMNRIDTIIEKCTELGMDAIYLWPASQSERKEIASNQMQRFRSLSIAAIKQCGRVYLPTITVLPHLVHWEVFPGEMFFGDLNGQAPRFMDIWREKKPKKAYFVIGPEAGLSTAEIKWMQEKGFTGVRLHQNILRTDTAAIVAAILMSL